MNAKMFLEQYASRNQHQGDLNNVELIIGAINDDVLLSGSQMKFIGDALTHSIFTANISRAVWEASKYTYALNMATYINSCK